MKNFTRKIAVMGLLSASLMTTVSAQAQLSKSQVKEQAIETCQTEAKQRYGADSILSTGDKAKWKKGLKGAAVKLKIKPEAKRATKYMCVLGLDSSVTFYKA